ncbi:hypothetical protein METBISCDRAFT_18027 [Metschnikowia bicuspidata]|uniref:Sld7 C-terminal domain-containing protein n=1 Tax=Metschnikowia bicuspidata TaxID=27322 RepID=A0A4P9ZAB1_9ASCO|nr:hypothetical protein METBISCDRAFT_18027 [Metschnikowia bicuspidata]
MPTITVTLRTAQLDYSDIQISSPDDAPYLRTAPYLSFVSLVNYRLIPFFLVSDGPFPVYSDNNATEAFFIRSLVRPQPKIGLLTKYPDSNGDVYVVFFVDEAACGIKCICLDFLVVSRMEELRDLAPDDENVFFARPNKLLAYKSDTTVFDRILENKSLRRHVTAPVAEKTVTGALLYTPTQILQAINKLILLGLRLRGLTVSELSSSKDKIAIREIHQMTRTAALFAMRKFNYDFNAVLRTQELLLSVLQDIVESLLQTFVDVPKSDWHIENDIREREGV